MQKKSNRFIQFWQELKRRNVLRTLAIYAGTAFIILEAVDIIFPRWGLPDWSVNIVLYLLIVGAIITVIISWIYDITPKGIVKTESLESIVQEQELTIKARKRLRTSNMFIAVLIVIIGILLYPKIFKDDSPLSGTRRNAIAVLPLKIIGEDSDVNHFASGLVESLTYMLTKVGNAQQSFSVIPASEILESITANEARQQFGASLVISGSIQMDGKTSRLILNVIDTKKQRLINSEKLDYQIDNNLILQDKIILVMVDMLGLQMESEMYNILTAGGSKSFEANELYLQGRGLLRESQSVKEIDDAIDLFDLAIKKDSLFALAYAGLAQAFTVKYHYTSDVKWADEALNYSRKAVELNDQDSYALISLASALVDRGEYEEAHELYRKSEELDSNNSLIYTELGYLYEMEQKYDTAEEYYRKAVSKTPSSFHPYYYLGVFYYYTSRFDEAIAEIKKGLLIAPSNHNLLNVLAACYVTNEDFDDAIIVFKQIIEADSTNGEILKNLGSVYFYKGNFDQAIQYYRKALRHIPQNFQLYGALGVAYFWSQQKELANQAFQSAVDIARDHLVLDPGVSINMIKYFTLMGETDSAYYYLEHSHIPDDPQEWTPQETFFTGEMFLILGEKQKALQWVESSLDRGYGRTEIKYSPFFKDILHDSEFKLMLSRYD